MSNILLEFTRTSSNKRVVAYFSRLDSILFHLS
jgi:hypothetical protein